MTKIMYHGTTERAYKEISKNGFNTPVVYLTNDIELALEHSDSEETVISVLVDIEKLSVDYDNNCGCPSIVSEANDEQLDIETFYRKHGQYTIKSEDIIEFYV